MYQSVSELNFPSPWLTQNVYFCIYHFIVLVGRDIETEFINPQQFKIYKTLFIARNAMSPFLLLVHVPCVLQNAVNYSLKHAVSLKAYSHPASQCPNHHTLCPNSISIKHGNRR